MLLLFTFLLQLVLAVCKARMRMLVTAVLSLRNVVIANLQLVLIIMIIM